MYIEKKKRIDIRSFFTKLIAISCTFCFLAMVMPHFTWNAAAENAAVPDGFSMVSKNEKLSLYAHPMGRIGVYQHATNTWWDSGLTDKQITTEKLNKIWQTNAQSLLYLSYAQDNAAGRKDFKTIGSADASVETSMKMADNTVSFDFLFTNQAIRVRMEISLHEDTVNVLIPDSSIEESGKAQMMDLEVLPFFGNAKAGTAGYAFVPDGCGALIRYDNPDHVADASSIFSWNIYGSNTPDIDRILAEKNEDVQVMVPVFGVKQGDHAFTAIVEKGDTEASIKVYPSGAVPYYRVAPEFHYRHTYTLSGSKISLTTESSANVKTSRERIAGDRSLHYVFSAGDDSTYSGMAQIYKRYLDEKKLLNHTMSDNEALPLQLEILMGTTEQRMLFDKYIPMTTYKQAADMVSALHFDGIDTVDCYLTGWYKKGKGSNVSSYKPESKLGGKKGLQELNEILIGRGDTMTLQTDAQLIQDASLRDNIVRHNATRDESQLVMSSANKKAFLCSPQTLLERFWKLINPMRSLPLKETGLQLDHAGKILYGDHNKNKTTLRSQSLETYQKIFKEGKKEGLLSVTGGNAYTFADADRILDIPVNTSGLGILDEAVPFLQMVLHGNIGYSSIPGNLFNNQTKDFLKWIEYGCLPYYRLTYESAANMRYTTSNVLYSSQFSQWQSKVTEVCSQLKQDVGNTYKAQMLSHEQITEDVACIKYDNGTIVYVNYGKNSYKLTQGETIAAESYLITSSKGGDNE